MGGRTAVLLGQSAAVARPPGARSHRTAGYGRPTAPSFTSLTAVQNGGYTRGGRTSLALCGYDDLEGPPLPSDRLGPRRVGEVETGLLAEITDRAVGGMSARSRCQVGPYTRAARCARAGAVTLIRSY